MILGWDLSSKICGWCAGDGATRPVAGAFQLHRREVLAELGCEFKDLALIVIRRFEPEAMYVEQPLLTSHDMRWTLERIYGVTFLLHTLAGTLGVPCTAVDQDTVKAEWGGKMKGKGVDPRTRQRQGKLLMVEMAERCGIELPATEAAGKFDAADACGVWKVGLRLQKSPHLSRWDAAIYRRRGGLL